MKRRLIKCFKIGLITITALLLAFSGVKSENNLPTAKALEKYRAILKDKTFLLITDLRENPIKWFDSIPEKRLKEGFLPKLFKLAGQPGEYYAYQIGVWALKSDIHDIDVEFSDLKSKDGKIISSGKMTCFNKGGINFKGDPFVKKVSVSAGRVQSLWMGIDLDSVSSGIYNGSVEIIVGNDKQMVPLQLNVSGNIVPNHGYNEANRLSRLSWLNSKAGIDDSITKGYLPVNVQGKKVSILGRSLQIADNGLPESILSYFAPSNISLMEKGEPIINSPFRFIIEKADGQIVRLAPEKLKFLLQTESCVVWSVLNTSEECDLECIGQMEFDGFVGYGLKLTAKVPTQIKDIRLEIPMNKSNAEYMMGLNHEGGLRSSDWKWRWDTSRNQDKLWIGAVNGGMQIKWKAENYVRPLVNSYYEYSHLNLPPSWGNEGKGGIDVLQKDNLVVINSYSGSRKMTKGEILHYDFELLITPFKTIDKKIKFGDRYYHGGGSIAKAKEEGANIINIHHGTKFYPFLNYPYLDENIEDLKRLAFDAHKENARLKLYNTTREITVNMPELWAFNSLQGEIYFPGPGNNTKTVFQPNGPDEWLKRNLREKYIPAWTQDINDGRSKGMKDVAIITTPDSRLNNFYIAGIDWMVRNIKIDGVYIDDSALDRYTIRRARKVIDRSRPEGRIEMHGSNCYNWWAGFTNCLNLYMEYLPYFDLVWIGEGRDYNRAPDHWLIEVSGIPFGLTGQMLEGGGNPWRGMVYGITTRAGYGGNPPTEIWKFWDKYKIEDKEMIGYWEKECPVICYNPMINATVYKGENESLIAIANWYKTGNYLGDQLVSVNVDFNKLGYDPTNCDISIPEIPDFQTAQTNVNLSNMLIPDGKGFIIVIKKK